MKEQCTRLESQLQQLQQENNWIKGERALHHAGISPQVECCVRVCVCVREIGGKKEKERERETGLQQ